MSERIEQPDFDRAAQMYVESSIAQHGDIETARWEAQEWWDIFRYCQYERDAERLVEEEAEENSEVAR